MKQEGEGGCVGTRVGQDTQGSALACLCMTVKASR